MRSVRARTTRSRSGSSWVRDVLGVRAAAHGLVVALSLVVFVLVRWFHPVTGVGNPDIAGILYSADIINAGQLPFRDTIDLKPPGAFFVSAAIFRLFGRSIETWHRGYEVFVLAGAPAVWVAARALFGAAERMAAALATALYIATIGLFDANYSSWMVPAYTWSFALLCHGLMTGSRAAHVGAGATALLAVLFKTQAVVLAPLFVACFFWARYRAGRSPSFLTLLFWIGGAVLAALPIVVPYVVGRALPALVRGIFPVAEAAEYAGRMVDEGATWNALYILGKRQGEAFPLILPFLVATLLGLVRDQREGRRAEPILPLVAFYAVSVWGCGIGGMRFYLHYFPQVLPSLALGAAHPAAVRWLGAVITRERSRFERALAGIHLVAIGAVLVWLAVRLPQGKAAAAEYKTNERAEQIGKFIAESSQPTDRVLVWGWEGWPVYFYANRRSPSPIFKVLGQVTDFNGDTKRQGKIIHFRPGPHADRLLKDVTTNPPLFIVRCVPFFPGIQNDPLDEFPALKRFIDRRYTLVAEIDALKVYERR